MTKPDEIEVDDKAEDMINDHFVEGSDLKKFAHAEQSDKVCTCCDMLVTESDKNNSNIVIRYFTFDQSYQPLLIVLLCA